MKRFLSLIAIAAFALLGAGALVHAQDSAPGLLITLSDAHPSAGESVSASVSSQSLDIDSVPISWYVNGKLLRKGIGMKQASIGSVSSGKTTVLAVAGTDPDTAQASVSFNPGILSLTWQSDSYVPPFYRGKALLPPEGDLTFVALPFFSRTQSSLGASGRINYQWKKDGIAYADQSGFGKNQFFVRGQIVDQPVRVEVTAENLDTGETAYAQATVGSSPPAVVLYRNDPLAGLMLNKALGQTTKLSDPEISLFAAPFGLSLGGLSYGWSMNYSPLAETSLLITLRAQDGISGTSTLSLSVQSSNKPLQKADTTVNLSYGGKQGGAANPFNK